MIVIVNSLAHLNCNWTVKIRVNTIPHNYLNLEAFFTLPQRNCSGSMECRPHAKCSSGRKTWEVRFHGFIHAAIDLKSGEGHQKHISSCKFVLPRPIDFIYTDQLHKQYLACCLCLTAHHWAKFTYLRQVGPIALIGLWQLHCSSDWYTWWHDVVHVEEYGGQRAHPLTRPSTQSPKTSNMFLNKAKIYFILVIRPCPWNKAIQNRVVLTSAMDLFARAHTMSRGNWCGPSRSLIASPWTRGPFIAP